MSKSFFVRVCMFTVSNALLMSSATAMVRAGWPQKRELGPLSSGQGKVDAICRSRLDRAKRPRAGCIFRSTICL